MHSSRQVSLVSRGPFQWCALYSSAQQVAFFWDVSAQSYVMIGNCCFWLVAITLLRPFNDECASSLAKFLCYFRNGIGLFSFVLAVKFQRDADDGVQDDDFISSCNIALLVLMSFCLLLDLWPLTEVARTVAEGGLHYLDLFEKHRNKRKSKSTHGRSHMPEPLAVPESRANREPVYMPAVAVASEAVVSDDMAPEALTYEQSASFASDWGDDLCILKSTREEEHHHLYTMVYI